MPAVFPQMNRDSIRPGPFTETSQRDGIGLHETAKPGFHLPVTGLAQGGSMVDINAEENHEGKIDQ